MKKKNLLILCVLLAVCIGCWLFLRAGNQTAEEEETTGTEETELVFGVEADAITEFSFETEGRTYTFVKEEDAWTYTGDKNFPVDEDALTQLLSPFAEVSATRVLTGVEDLSEYGLLEPSNTIRLTDDGGTEYVLYIGNMNSTTGDYYVRTEAEDRVYTIGSTIPLSFQIGLYDLAMTEDFPAIDASEVTALQVKTPDALFTAALDAGSNTAWHVGDGTDTWEGDEEQIMELLDGLGSISYTSCLEYDCQNPEPYGLTEPAGWLTVRYQEISAASSETSDAEISDAETDSMTEAEAQDGTTEVVFAIGSLDESGTYYYVQRQGSGEVHTVTASLLEPYLAAEAGDYRSLALSNLTMDETASVTLNYQGTAWEFVQEEIRTENEDGEETISYTCTRNGVSFDVDTYQSFFKIARGMMAQSYVEEMHPEEEESFSLIFESTSGTLRTVSYHPYDENFYLAVVDHETCALVNKMDVATLTEYIQTVVK